MNKVVLLIFVFAPFLLFGSSFGMRLGTTLQKATGDVPEGTHTESLNGFVGAFFYQPNFMGNDGFGLRPELRYIDSRSRMWFSEDGEKINYSVKNIDLFIPIHYTFVLSTISVLPSFGLFGGISFDETEDVASQNPRFGFDFSVALEFKLGLGAPRLGIEVGYSRTFTNIFEDQNWDGMVWHGLLLTFFIRHDIGSLY